MYRHGAIFLLSGAALLAACSSSDEGGSTNGASTGTGGRRSGTGGSANGGSANGGTGGGTSTGTDGGGTSGSTGTGGSSGAAVDLEMLRNSSCAGWEAATEVQPSILQLVVDISGSMDQQAPGTSSSKWQVTRQALDDAIYALPDSIAVGVLYYPNMDTTPSEPAGDATDPPRDVTACVNTGQILPIDVLGPTGAPHRTAVDDSLYQINGPAGGTPTHDAYRYALGALNASQLPGSRYMLLITDGQPTFLDGCRGTGNIVDAVDPTPIIGEAQLAMMEGVKTFVIGSPGSEEVGVPIYSDARTWLSMTATVGGTAKAGCSDDGPNFCHFDMTQEADFSTALREALRDILGAIVSCEYSLPAPPQGEELDPSKVNVVFSAEGSDPELITQAADANCTEGWRYSADGTLIEICPSTCDRIQGAIRPEVEVLFGCATEVTPIR